MTYARVAVLTGLSRKEVVRILSDKQPKVPQPKIAQNRATRVLMGWITDPDFCDEDGHPAILNLRVGETSFAKLVEKYSGDITAGAIIDDLIINGIVKKDDQDRVKLLSSGYITPQDDLEKFEVLSYSVANLLITGAHNIENKDQTDLRFQREYNRNKIPASLAQEFKTLSEQKSQELLVELFNWVRERSKNSRSIQEDEPKKRIGLGIYYIEDDHEDDPPNPTEDT